MTQRYRYTLLLIVIFFTALLSLYALLWQGIPLSPLPIRLLTPIWTV